MELELLDWFFTSQILESPKITIKGDGLEFEYDRKFNIVLRFRNEDEDDKEIEFEILKIKPKVDRVWKDTGIYAKYGKVTVINGEALKKLLKK